MKIKRELLALAIGSYACTRPLTAPAPSPIAPVASPGALNHSASQPAMPATNSAASAAPPPGVALTPKPVELTAVTLALPGATAPVALDFLFYEPEKARVWVPAGGSGAVDVFDIAKHGFVKIEGFKTVEREAHGKKRVVGPSAGAIAASFAYIGNRATQEVCAVDLQTLKKGACLKLADAIDCVEFVSSKQQVWVTTPGAQSLVVLDALPKGLLKQKATIKVEGAPEGYALDEQRGLFLTNLEDKGTTLGIDVTTHAVTATWNAACAADGPRGVAVDSARALLFVACTDHVQILDMAHGAPYWASSTRAEGSTISITCRARGSFTPRRARLRASPLPASIATDNSRSWLLARPLPAQETRLQIATATSTSRIRGARTCCCSVTRLPRRRQTND